MAREEGLILKEGALIEKMTISRMSSIIRDMAALGSRVTGGAGANEAAAYIQKRFNEIGLEGVVLQEFPVTIPVDEGSRVEIIGTGENFKVYPLWPNDVCTSSLPAGGVEGKLLYVPFGELSAFDGLNVRNAVVLMDFNSGNNWLNAALLGARAVIFIEPLDTNRLQGEVKFLNIPLHFPRFWLRRSDAEILLSRLSGVTKDGGEMYVKLHSRVVWKEAVGKNILGVIRGRDSRLSGQVVILQANYDSMSVVPQLAPGAEQAAGVAALLELGRSFVGSPPKRTVILLATAGHGEAMAGMRAFLDNQLFVEEHGAGGPGQIDYLYKPIKDIFLFSLDLSSGGQRVGLFHRGYFYNLQPPPKIDMDKRFSTIGGLFDELASLVGVSEGKGNKGNDGNEGKEGDAAAGTFVNAIISDKSGRAWQDMLAIPLGFSSEVFTLAGGTGLAFTTLDDLRLMVDTPFDDARSFNEERGRNLYVQVELIGRLVREFLNLPPERFPVPVNMGNYFNSAPKSALTSSSPATNLQGSPFGVVSVRLSNQKTLAGVRGTSMVLPDPSKEFRLVGLPGVQGGGGTVDIRGYLLDPDSGSIVASPDMAGGYNPSFKSDRREKSVVIPLFRGTNVMMYDLVERGNFRDLSSFTYFHPATGLPPKPSGYVLPTSPDERVLLLFMEPGTPFSIRMERADGSGIYVAEGESGGDEGSSAFLVGDVPLNLPFSQLYFARGTWSMNERMINLLKRRGIQQDLMVKQNHVMAGELLKRAQEDLRERHYQSLLQNSRAAAHLSGENLVMIRRILEDVTDSAIFYLILALPFAYFAERLIFNAYSRQVQLAFRLVTFGSIFFLLRWVHPAFDTSSRPYKVGGILVAIDLILTVLGPRLNRFLLDLTRSIKETFEHERRHQIDIGRFTAAIMAFLLGIANMRERRLRTALTMTTLVLLSFTVLSFISIQPHLSYVKTEIPIQLPSTPSSSGAPFDPYADGAMILIRDGEGKPLPEVTGDIIRALYGEKVEVFPRSQYLPEKEGEGGGDLIYYDGRGVKFGGVMGITAKEVVRGVLSRILLAGRWFEPNEKGTCLLSDALAEAVGFSPDNVGEGRITLFGRDFVVIGILDGERYSQMKDLDGQVLTPIFLMEGEGEGKKGVASDGGISASEIGTGEMVSEDLGASVEIKRLPPSGLVFLPHEELRKLGGTLISFLVDLGEGWTKGMNLDALRARLPYEFVMRKDGRVVTYRPRETITLKGLENLAVPMVLVALIVLNTMLGAVYERHREIAIFSAVGLSPGHIGSLFFGESCVYAIVGSLLGYLLGQMGAKVVTAYDLLPGLSLNYSSFVTVYSILMVMGVVALSSIYPAIMASKLAVPAIERRWRMPKMVETRSELSMPFVFSPDEALGAITFLKSIFDGMSDKSYPAGSVYKSEFSRVEGKDGESYLLEMYVHLAPYDLGINQRVELWMNLDKSGREYELRAILERLTGDVSSWNRSNHPFLSELRKQCLVWRTLSPEIKEDYARKGAKLLFAREIQVSVDEMVQELVEVICPHCGRAFPLSRQHLLRLVRSIGSQEGGQETICQNQESDSTLLRFTQEVK